MSPKFQKRSALKFVGRIIPCANHIGISRETEDNATSREVRHILALAGAEIPIRGIENTSAKAVFQTVLTSGNKT